MADAARYAELWCAAVDLSDRGLQQPAKWATEMLCGLPPGSAAAASDLLAAAAGECARAPDPPALMLARCCFTDRVGLVMLWV